MNVEQVNIDSVIPYARNPRKNDAAVDKVVASLKEFGWQQPIVVDKELVVVAGHTRLLAAKQLGMGQVPIHVAKDLTPEQAKAYRLADNRTAEEAAWDMELLGLEIRELDDLDFDLDLTGFNNLELSNLLIDPDLGETDEDAIPEPPEEPISKLGHLWILGEHRLLCGDATNIEDVERLMDGQQADMWLTDPPYNIAYEGGSKKRKAIDNDSMEADEFRQFLRDCYGSADQYMRAGAVFYIWHADSEGYNFRGAAIDLGWNVRQTLIWNKNNSGFGRSDFHWKHEPCLYGWKEGAAHTWTNDRKQTTVLDFDRPSRSEVHPTMKPVDLIEYCIGNNTKNGDVVLDSFGGSGTTLIACQKNGRKARLMELDPRYCDVIMERWEQYSGKQATLEKREAA